MVRKPTQLGPLEGLDGGLVEAGGGGRWGEVYLEDVQPLRWC